MWGGQQVSGQGLFLLGCRDGESGDWAYAGASKYQLGPGGAVGAGKAGVGRDLWELDKTAGLSKCGRI